MRNNWVVALVFVALVSLFNVLFAAPTVVSSPPPQDEEGVVEFYDQRQNGTENIRIDLNGVVIVVSPLEALLTAASLFDPSLFQDFDTGIDFFKKQPEHLTDKIPNLEKPIDNKPERNNIRTSTEKSRKKGSKLRIGNIITPLLRRKNQDQ